jgi:hypothetical protein
MNGRLEITPNYWLNPERRNAKSIREQLDMVRKMPKQMQKASEEAIRLNWYTRQDSNLRPTGSKPATLIH